jgi:carbon monoxide dehydrogenase subunit G
LATFSARNVSEAVVPVAPAAIWRLLADARELTALTPLVRRIDVAGETWVWHLAGIAALGVSVEPSFTESMIFDEARSITFEHRPPDGVSERAGARGRYELHDLGDGRTRLFIDITLCVELPLPRASRRAVERVMATTMQRTGDRFGVNLYRRLGVDARAASSRTLAS